MSKPVFTLGRMVDPRYPTNRYMVLITVLAVFLGRWVLGTWIPALVYGSGFFFTWALAREFDPAHDFSAFVAGAIYLLVLPYFEGLSIGPIFLLLLLHRLLTRICGKEPTVVDGLSIVGLLLYLSIGGKQAIYPLVTMVAFLFAYIRYDRNPLWGLLTLLSMVFTMVALVLWELDPVLPLQSPLLLVGLGVSLVFAFLHYRWLTHEADAPDDTGGEVPIRWVRLGTFFYALVLVILTLAVQLEVATIWVLQAVPMGVGLYGIGKRRWSKPLA